MNLQGELVWWAKASLPKECNYFAKLVEEFGELQASPNDINEMADVCLALMLYAESKGVDLLAIASLKFNIVQRRKYGACSSAGISRHIEK